MRRLIAPLLLLLGVAAWFWWPHTEVAPEPAPAGFAPSPRVATNDPVLPLPTAAAVPAVPADALRVEVEVTELERFMPPPVARVEAVSSVDGRPLPTALLAGAGAGYEGSAETNGLALVRVECGGMQALRLVAVTVGAMAKPAYGARLVVRGTVRSPNREPLAGALVWFGEQRSDGAEHTAVTDAEGAFELDVLAGDGVPFVVRHPQMASMWRAVRVATPLPPFDAMLQPGATLAVQLAGAAVAMDDARVFVLPASVITSEWATWPFFAQALDDGFALAANGSAVLTGLPRHGEVGLLVRHPRLPLARPTAVVLKGERNTALLPVTFAERLVRGQVVDEHGALLAGVALWSLPAGQPLRAGSAQRFVPPHLDTIGAFAARSDSNGALLIAAHSADDAVLRLRGHGFAGRDLPLAGMRDGSDIVLPRFAGGEPQFTLTAPMAGQRWFGRCNLSGGVAAALEPNAGWRLSLPAYGRFRFDLRAFRGEVSVAAATTHEIMVTGPIELPTPAAK
jgi:hypothetical protein